MSAREWYDLEPDEKYLSFSGDCYGYRYGDKLYSFEFIQELRERQRLRELLDGISEDMLERYAAAVHGVASRLHRVLKRNGAL